MYKYIILALTWNSLFVWGNTFQVPLASINVWSNNRLTVCKKRTLVSKVPNAKHILYTRGGSDNDDLTSSKTSPSLAGIAALSFSTVTAISYFVPGNAIYEPWHDLGASLLCAILGTVYVKLITTLSINGLSSRDTRKIIHTGSAPLFMLLWPLFSDDASTTTAAATTAAASNFVIWPRIFAALVPFLNGIRLYIAGSRGAQGSEGELLKAVSRSGDKEEALGGPFLYCGVLLGCILLFWRGSMSCIMALCTMAAGDGMADIIGRRYGSSNKWSFSPDKSMAGTMAFIASSTIVSLGLALWFQHFGVLTLENIPILGLGLRILVISVICALVELLPLGDDNWTVPLSAALLAKLLFP